MKQYDPSSQLAAGGSGSEPAAWLASDGGPAPAPGARDGRDQDGGRGFEGAIPPAADSDRLVYGRLSRAEAKRRVWHFLPGFLPFVLQFKYHRDPLSWDARAILLVGITALMLVVLYSYRSFKRRGERNGVASIVSYPATILLTLFLFPAHAEFGAVVAVVLAFGDGSATLGGLLFGRRALPWNAEKTWFGSVCFVVFAAPLAVLAYLGEARPAVPLGAAVACGVSATVFGVVAECCPSRLNDNLRVGVAAALGVVVAHAVVVGPPI